MATDQNNRPVIGWESTAPVPEGYEFNRYLQAHNGELHLDGVSLASFFRADNPLGRPLKSPLEVVYLPLITRQIQRMQDVFANVIAELGYDGRFHYTYASKANAAEEVIRTTLGSGAHHEMSSTIDVDIALRMIDRGLLTPEKMVICNGFKAPGSDYAANIIQLRDRHENLIPVIEDLTEIAPLLDSGKTFNVGLRLKSYGPNETAAEMDAANSRFGLDSNGIWKAADYISAAPNLNLTMFHNMVGSQITDPDAFVAWLTPGIELYAQLRQRYPTLQTYNFGGGMPVGLTLDFAYDYHQFARLLLTKLQETCVRYNVPVPDVTGEFGRYTTSEHGAHLFNIITAKDNGSDKPWYIINGSIMSSFPDSWALGEHFILLPLNHLDTPFQQVQIGGITCDSDDVYPPKPSKSPLYLPVETEGLQIGFFSIGAYQEMLGGVRGSKHCVLPEANELILDRDAAGKITFEVLPGQTAVDVLLNLGYKK